MSSKVKQASLALLAFGLLIGIIALVSPKPQPAISDHFDFVLFENARLKVCLDAVPECYCQAIGCCNPYIEIEIECFVEHTDYVRKVSNCDTDSTCRYRELIQELWDAYEPIRKTMYR